MIMLSAAVTCVVCRCATAAIYSVAVSVGTGLL